MTLSRRAFKARCEYVFGKQKVGDNTRKHTLWMRKVQQKAGIPNIFFPRSKAVPPTATVGPTGPIVARPRLLFFQRPPETVPPPLIQPLTTTSLMAWDLTYYTLYFSKKWNTKDPASKLLLVCLCNFSFLFFSLRGNPVSVLNRTDWTAQHTWTTERAFGRRKCLLLILH